MAEENSFPAEHPEKLDLTSLDIAAEQREKLRQLFPEAITEGGKVDFDRLKATLGEVVDTGKERYGMNWPGKSECFRTIQAPSRATLRPCREESVNFDTAENLIIEGDNLEALKLLQKGYLGKVKMIYIDPPYNTGNEFIYPDNYSESLDTYLSYTGQVDAGGRKFSTNTETDGRFHSKWMNMMYPRLFLARNLLREDGVIFISIDDHEVDNQRKLCNEVFGEDCFLASVIWQKRTSPDARASLGAAHDYILVYVKNKTDKKSPLNLLPISLQRSQEFKNPDSDPRGPWASVDLTGQTGHATESQFYNVTSPKGVEFAPPEGRCWALSEKTFQALIADKRIWFGRDGTSRPRQKQFLSETKGMTSWTWWSNEEVGHNQEATKELTALLNEADTFTNPKPIRLIQRVLQLSTNNNTNDIILDFFAGSGTTAQAVLELNKQDGGNRKFILVQLPEPTEREDYKTIADITKERVRRVIQKMAHEATKTTKEEEDTNPLNLDLRDSVPSCEKSPPPGFKVFKLDTSNFKTWDGVRPESPEAVVQQLELHVDHVLAGRTQEDILTELLLKSGFPLSTKVEAIQLAGKPVFSLEDGAMLICLDDKLTPEVIKAMADKKPSRVICLDAGFQGSDQLKTNAVQTMKARGVLKFQTV
jgi:adenine-specific DNA-methyltransferase